MNFAVGEKVIFPNHGLELLKKLTSVKFWDARSHSTAEDCVEQHDGHDPDVEYW